MKKLLWVLVIAFSLNVFSQSTTVKFLSAKVSSDGLKITMNFNKAIYGTNKGFTIYNTRSKTFNSVTGFGTKVLVGTLTSPVIYGEPVNISYKSIETLNNISGDLVDIGGINVGYFLKELVDTSAIIFTGVEKYVTATASGGGDGSISNPYTFEEMIINLEAFNAVSTTGTRFNIKAGSYGKKESSSYKINGKIGKPIIIEGYTTNVGDNPDVKWDYNTNRNMDSSIMPLFDGEGAGNNPFTFSASSYITIKNIQAKNYAGTRAAIYFNNSNNIYVNNCIVEKFDRGINIAGGIATSFDNVVTNSIVLNGYRTNFQINGKNQLMQNCMSYADNTVGDATDYYYSMRGENNVLRNNYGNRVGILRHTGHGLSISTLSTITNGSDTGTTQYNFIDGHISVNMAKPIEFRHGGTKNNIARGIVGYTGTSGAKTAGGITFRDNASFNIVEDSYIHDSNRGISYVESIEVGVGLGHDNIIRNSIFSNNIFGIRIENSNSIVGDGSNNKIYNCIFNNLDALFRIVDSNITFSNNEFKNNIFNDVVIEVSGSTLNGWDFEYNNFFNSFEKTSGTGNISKDPQFEDASGGNFRLKSDSPLIDKGINLSQVKFDFDGNHRPQGSSIDIGAFEFKDGSTSAIDANAGEDQAICQGETITLTASGGSTYSWSTGATTKSITVSPNETTIYTVTVTEGSTSDNDTVTVAVSSVTADAGANKTINEGESITLTANGGDSYVWSTGETTQSITVSPANTATYTVTAKKGDCEDTDTVQVTVDQNNDTTTVTANAGSNQNICQGESVTLTASGGSTYSWSTGATTKSITVSPTETTTYSVAVSEGSATDSDTVIVAVSSVTADAGTDKTINEGESITLTANGGDSYVWSTGETSKSIAVSPRENQIYTLTAYRNGCEDTDTVLITVNKKDTSPPPAKANAGEDQTICLGENIKLTASGGSTYEWSTGETTKSIFVNPTRTTSYSVTATRGGVTNSDAVIVTVENCSAISNTGKQEDMTVFPNPTTGTINIKADNGYSSLNLNIYGMNGSVVYSDVVQTNNKVAYKSVDLSNLSKGIYFVRMFNSDYHKVKKFLLY